MRDVEVFVNKNKKYVTINLRISLSIRGNVNLIEYDNQKNIKIADNEIENCKMHLEYVLDNLVQ